MADHGLHAAEEPVPAHRVERRQHVGPCRVARVIEQQGKVSQRVVVVGGKDVAPVGGTLGQAVERTDLHVEVPHVPERGRHPSKFGAKDTSSHRQDVDEEIEGRSQAPGGDADVVELFGVFAETGAGLLVPQD